MAKFTSVLKKLGITEADLSQSLKKRIKDYNALAVDIKNKRSALSKGGYSEEEVEGLNATITEYEKLLVGADEELVSKIESWFPNREKYAEMSKNLHPRIPNSKKQQAAPPEPPTPEAKIETPPAEPAPTPPVSAAEGTELKEETPAPEPPAETPPAEPVATPEAGIVKEGKKKKAPWGLLGFLGLTAIGILVGTNMANRD